MFPESNHGCGGWPSCHHPRDDCGAILSTSGRLPWDPKNFKFLGSPVDGIAFESDQVVIVEFKTAGSQMSRRQRDIQKLVEEGTVFFREIRLEA